MAQFKVEIVINKKGLKADQVASIFSMKVAGLLSEELKDATISRTIKKINLAPSRSERLAEANDLKASAFDIVTGLADEMQEWHDNLPENLQSSDKASAIEECQSSLQQAADDLENIDLESIDFPGAF